MEKLHFTIQGEFITGIAREKLFMDKDLGSALRILRSSLESDEIDSDEQLMLCLAVLNGDASIEGQSGTDEYGLKFRDDIDKKPTQLESIAQLILDMKERIEGLEKENHDCMQKIGFLSGQIPDYKIRSVNNEYYAEYGEPLFSDIAVSSWAMDAGSPVSGMLESYLEQRRVDGKKEEKPMEYEDYGWLEPDGTFHPVEWGNHSKWAGEWLKEHKPLRDFPELYKREDSSGNIHHIYNGDVLVFSLGWVLLDNPWQGLARATVDPKRGYTNAQREMLFDYYMERNRTSDANALYED